MRGIAFPFLLGTVLTGCGLVLDLGPRPGTSGGGDAAIDGGATRDARAGDGAAPDAHPVDALGADVPPRADSGADDDGGAAVDGGGSSSRAVGLTAGSGHTCAILETGAMRCWGENGQGQLGIARVSSSEPPSTVSPFAPLVGGASGGFLHTCAHAGGQAWCWGSRNDGRLGDGVLGLPNPDPTLVASLADVVAIAAGFSHSCAVLTSARFACWGDNGSGRLGNGDTTSSLVPVERTGPAPLVGITAGQTHTCAWGGGSVWCWGAGSVGQLGNTMSEARAPSLVDLAGVVQVDAGDNHTCAIAGSGAVLCWGSNPAGRAVPGAAEIVPVPTEVIDDSAIDVSAGGTHTCAVLSSGSIRCWGANDAGQLGDGTMDPSSGVVDVVGVTDAVDVECGAAHTCALDDAGGVRCWGRNRTNELGDSTFADRATPGPVPL